MTEPGPTLPLTGDDADAVAALVHAAEQAVGQELVTRPRFRDAAGGGGGDLAGVVTWSADRRQPLAYVQVARDGTAARGSPPAMRYAATIEPSPTTRIVGGKLRP